MRVLIVDDSRTMRSILRQILEETGAEIFEACNGREALDRLKQIGKTDLVLIDWNLPEMNGLDFVRAVRAGHEYDNTRLMMVTTEVEMSQVNRAMSAGADEYVMKPFTKAVILEKLDLLGIRKV